MKYKKKIFKSYFQISVIFSSLIFRPSMFKNFVMYLLSLLLTSYGNTNPQQCLFRLSFFFRPYQRSQIIKGKFILINSKLYFISIVLIFAEPPLFRFALILGRKFATRAVTWAKYRLYPLAYHFYKIMVRIFLFKMTM